MKKLIPMIIAAIILLPFALIGLLFFTLGILCKDISWFLTSMVFLAGPVATTIVMVRNAKQKSVVPPTLTCDKPAEVILTPTPTTDCIFCSRCGAALSSTCKYCTDCGSKVK